MTPQEGPENRTEATWIGPIEIFRGQAYYWIASGPVPLAVADELYEHPLGRSAVRVDGDCTCPAPRENRIAWYTPDGRRVYRFESALNQVPMSPLMAQIYEEYRSLLVFHDQPEQIATPYVELYHIDGDEALALFDSVLRKHSVDRAVRPPWWNQRFGAYRGSA